MNHHLHTIKSILLLTVSLLLFNVSIAQVPVSGSDSFIIRGKVEDTAGEPLPGVSIVVKEMGGGTTTTPDGTFVIELGKGKKVTLVFSYVGMQSQEKSYDGTHNYKDELIVLKESDTKLNEVVVTGMFSRRAESFTGSASTFTQEDLKTSGNQNLLKSIKNLALCRYQSRPRGDVRHGVRHSR